MAYGKNASSCHALRNIQTCQFGFGGGKGCGVEDKIVLKSKFPMLWSVSGVPPPYMLLALNKIGKLKPEYNNLRLKRHKLVIEVIRNDWLCKWFQ